MKGTESQLEDSIYAEDCFLRTALKLFSIKAEEISNLRVEK